MSEMSLLWHEYKRYNDLAREITDDVMLLKRVRLKLPGNESASGDDIHKSREQLVAFVNALTRSLSPSHSSGVASDTLLPGTLVERVRQANSGLFPRFLVEMEALRAHLSESENALAERDLEILDSLSNCVNVETSRVFKSTRLIL